MEYEDQGTMQSRNHALQGTSLAWNMKIREHAEQEPRIARNKHCREQSSQGTIFAGTNV
jgi:hypothetical protein